MPSSLSRRPLVRSLAAAGVVAALALVQGSPAWAKSKSTKGQSAASAASSAEATHDVVKVDNAWVRPAAKGQSGTGGYLRLTSSKAVTLVGLSSPVAGLSQLHEMFMQGDVMRMRELGSVSLPAGQAVEFKPGANHLMLMNLKQALKVGDQVEVTLIFKDEQGKRFTQKASLPVQTMPAGGMGGGMGEHHGDMRHGPKGQQPEHQHQHQH